MTEDSVSEPRLTENEELSPWNEFLLIEIKAKDDALRQLMSIDALLIGAYVAVLLNNINQIAALPIIQKIYRESYATYGTLVIIIILLPITLWGVAMFFFNSCSKAD